MCEFKVSLNKLGKEMKVSEDIVCAQVDRDTVFLKDALGCSKKVKSAFIGSVDVSTENLKLVWSPFISRFFTFIDEYNKCVSKDVKNEKLESKWLKIKALGDEMIRSIGK